MTAFITEFLLGPERSARRIGIKDTIDVAGFPTTAASKALQSVPPASRHADVVQRLLDAGWCISGKTNMHELAFGMTGINAYTGTPVNPQNPLLIPGGSSSGSASAVGLSLVEAALGTDTGGSIRGPAACCGIVGLKPTFGRVPRKGVQPVHTSLDCVGPLARDVPTIIDVMKAICEDFDPALTAFEAAQRVALVHVDAEPTIVRAVEHSLEIAQIKFERITISNFKDAYEAGLAIINDETYREFGHLLSSGQLGSDVHKRLRVAATTTRSQVVAAELIRASFTTSVDELLSEFDVLILPTMPVLPLTLKEVQAGASVIPLSSLIRPFNLSGHPAMTIPIELLDNELKSGLQIVGRKEEDERVCAVAGFIEQALAAQRK